MSSILMSGVSGFVGQNLSRHLKEKGHDIISLIRHAHAGNSVGDISWDNMAALKTMRLDAFVHLAGKAHDLKNTSDPEEYFTVNTGLTSKLFDSFLQGTASTFIFFSSVKAATDSVEGVLTEDITPQPKTPYGESKCRAEAYILGRQLPTGKRVFILRPCMIHGPGNKGNLNLLYQVVKKGIPYPLAAFDNKRSFLSIANLNFVVESILANPALPGGIYNLADDEPLSTNQLIKLLATVSGRKARLWKLSPVVIKAIASIGDILHLPLNNERLKKLTENFVVSNQKVKQALNISLMPVSAREGLTQTIKSFSTE
ncbi:NAD-dependent epimerase/dehydratase family protein [Mucilaginibacter sp. AK015]|uniref:NAD-dependent epimerase/dehydratase family protein n=1 Tax=Mucilaginibacter sp. AK015 TaxID=2723072 RepID=UPI00161A8F6A|nr:NAD-dependent epimerase/dehydratase family protein [Mucilaginibacter sp. AK015]MBB5396042.1 nucleoside-diphosphate-sugar epimerase [Mucilaginibacter sp. AK015]